MKYAKIFALTLGAFLLTACSDDDSLNSEAGVTVQMGKSEVKVTKGTDLSRIPVVVSGETNGPVKIEVTVEGVSAQDAVAAKPFEKDQNGNWSGDYILTSEKLTIGAGETTGYLELTSIWDGTEGLPQELKITIVKAEGATIGNVASTLVILKDPSPYEKLFGNWAMTYTDYDGVQQTDNIKISGYAEGEAGYESHYIISPFYAGLSSMSIQLNYAFDPATQTMLVYFTCPCSAGIAPLTIGNLEVTCYIYDGSMNLYYGNLVGEVNADRNQIEFEEGLGMFLTVPVNGSISFIDTMSDIVMTKK